MKHTGPLFWNYALAYFLIGGGAIALVLEVPVGGTSGWTGMIMVWLGAMVLTAAMRKPRNE